MVTPRLSRGAIGSGSWAKISLMPTIPEVTLNDGHRFAQLGLGTYGLRAEEGRAAVASAIGSGYRLLDTALNYGNEGEVGEGIRRSSVDRDELTVTTKLPGRHHGYEETIASARASLAALRLDRIDLYLIHWPNPRINKYVDTWKAMIHLRDEGMLGSIGVSNFTAPMLDRLTQETGVVPAVNQIELHPYFPQADLRAYHAEQGIRTESWSPLAKRSRLLNESIVQELAEVYRVTPSQIVLRWHVDIGSTPIPKSGDPDRQRENADIFAFSLDDEDIAAISELERGRLWNGDPETHEEF